MKSDEVNAGERSDRFGMVDGTLQSRAPRRRGGRLAPGRGDTRRGPTPAGRSASVAVPRDYAELRGAEPSVASAWRDASAAAIESCLGAGMVAAAFDAQAPVPVRRSRGSAGVTRVRSIERRLVAMSLVPLRHELRGLHREGLHPRAARDRRGGGLGVRGRRASRVPEEWNDGAWIVLRDLPRAGALGRRHRFRARGGGVRVRPRAPDGEGDARGRADRRRARAEGPLARSMLGATRDRVEGSPAGIAASTEELLAQVDGYRRGLPADQAEDRARHRRRTRPRGPRGAPGHPARSTRTPHTRSTTSRCSRARRVRAAHGRAAATRTT